MLNICYVFPIRKNLIRNFIETPPASLFISKVKLGNSKLCEFCIYRVSFLTGTPLKVSVYNVNCAEIGLSARI